MDDEQKSQSPVFTQRMVSHINGGNRFSSLTYEIFADGQPTGIRRATVTSGSPRYLKTEDSLADDQSVFDILKTKGVGMQAWLEERIAAKKGATS